MTTWMVGTPEKAKGFEPFLNSANALSKLAHYLGDPHARGQLDFGQVLQTDQLIRLENKQGRSVRMLQH